MTAKAAFNECIHADAERYFAYASDGDEDFYKPIIALLQDLDADQWLTSLRHTGLPWPSYEPVQRGVTSVDP